VRNRGEPGHVRTENRVRRSLAGAAERTALGPCRCRVRQVCAFGSAVTMGTGTEAEQRKGDRAVRIIPVNGRGPEDIAVDAYGALLTGVEDGRILRVSSDGRRIEVLADTGGRPLGIEVGPDGHLVVCDAERGLLSVDPASGTVLTLVEKVAGERMLVCNNAAVDPEGTIYFTDSSRRHPLAHYEHDLLDNVGTGRLLRRDPEGGVDVLLEGLRFANGVALADDGSFVAVAETGGYRIHRVWLTGSRAGQSEVLADLPGFPDNMSTGADGVFWVALPQDRNPALDLLHRIPPGPRRGFRPLVDLLADRPPRTTGLVGVSADGRIAHHVRLVGGDFRSVTGVRQHGDHLYLGSLVARGIAVLDRPTAAHVTEHTRDTTG
jgi:sugar lactone lactonase YvrE